METLFIIAKFATPIIVLAVAPFLSRLFVLIMADIMEILPEPPQLKSPPPSSRSKEQSDAEFEKFIKGCAIVMGIIAAVMAGIALYAGAALWRVYVAALCIAAFPAAIIGAFITIVFVCIWGWHFTSKIFRVSYWDLVDKGYAGAKRKVFGPREE